jgi:arabinan endo-1,5-alpha-L-arabinosidase
VFDHDAPDPTVIRAPDGSFYAFTTQSEHDGRLVHVPVLRSSDMVRWDFVGEALPELPEWAGARADTWAPHVQRMGGRYVMFVSVRDGLTGLMQVATAVARSPAGPFEPTGGRLLGRRDETIDPQVLALNGRRYLYWSQENTVRVAPLRAGGLEVARPGAVVLEPVGVEGSGYRSVVEGAWVIPHGRFLYLFTSGDRCCGSSAHYAVSVARSRDPFGPFSRRRGGPVLAAGSGVIAPGHNAVIAVGGRDWMVFHAMVGGSEDRVLMIDPITWRGGWPHVRAGSPSTTRLRGPRTR